MDKAEFDKGVAELPSLRRFIDFVNQQVGVYCACLSSFSGNKVRIERQIPRVLRPSGRRIENGRPVVMHTSVEDPSSPDILHHRIVRAEDFIAENAECGFNERQVCRAIIVFIFAYWDEEIRPEIARVRGVAPGEVKLDELGDLRILRHSIVHAGGLLSASEHAKLRAMSTLFKPDKEIAPSHDDMHKLFIHVKQAIGKLILTYTGGLPGAPEASEIVGVAIQNAGRRGES